jgi:hypothetical protein
MQVGQSVVVEAVDVEKCTLLPSRWYAMTPEEKRDAFYIIEENK